MVPFHNSVNALGPVPPKAKAAVLIPVPPNLYLSEFKSLTSVQLVPFQSSVLFATPGVLYPPKPKAAVCVPADVPELLPLFKALLLVQDVPS